MKHAKPPVTVICVGAVVRKDDSVLVVRQSQGHPLEGRWTIPWGRVEEGESPCAAALREALEEGGVAASIDGLLGVQELPSPWNGWIGIVYRCEHVSGTPKPDNYETDQAAYLTRNQVDELRYVFEPWSLWLVRKSLGAELTLTESDASNPYNPSVGFL